jgi:hypothetical protein
MDGISKLKSPRIKKPMTIQKVFSLPGVKPFSYGPVKSVACPDTVLLYGLELEIERASFDWEISGFRATEDGSLRNNGVEFISAPMDYGQMAHGLQAFFKNARTDSRCYSERTSIHVHTNCLDLTVPQLTSLLMMYQVVEDLLFAWIGEERDKNIFCVPWSQTKLTHNVLANIEQFVSMSSVERNKYTALNLVPLRTQGTIEWRHMHGHNDVERILTWLRVIGHFYRVAKKYEHDVIVDKCVNLNTTSAYDHLLDFLFEDEAVHFRMPNYRIMLENGVLNMKYSLQMKQPKVEGKALKKTVEFVTNYGADLRWGDFVAQVPPPVADTPPDPIAVEEAHQRARQRIEEWRVQEARRRLNLDGLHARVTINPQANVRWSGLDDGIVVTNSATGGTF